jgi:N-acyl-D-amino-acid deacylase
MELVEVVRRVTSLPASLFGIPARGTIREGQFADLVVFDPKLIGDRATAAMPAALASGVDFVVVNGVTVLTPRGLTGARPGRRVVPSQSQDAR